MNSIKIDFPNITATTAEGKLSQINDYLFSLVNKLNHAIQIGDSNSSSDGTYTPTQSASASNAVTSNKAESTFNDMRDLIINSAEIVSAYAEKIQKTLKGKYVATSDFGEFVSDRYNKLEATANGLASVIKDSQTVISGADVKTVDVNGFIRAGVIGEEDGVPVIGIALGQTNTADGQDTFNKAVQITSDKMSFFDAYGNEVAYFSDESFKILRGEIKDFMRFGEYDVDVSYGVAWKYRGSEVSG